MPLVVRVGGIKGPAKLQQHDLLVRVAILLHNGAYILDVTKGKEAVATILGIARRLGRVQFWRRGIAGAMHTQGVEIAIAATAHGLVHLVVENIIRHGDIAIVASRRHTRADDDRVGIGCLDGTVRLAEKFRIFGGIGSFAAPLTRQVRLVPDLIGLDTADCAGLAIVA